MCMYMQVYNEEHIGCKSESAKMWQKHTRAHTHAHQL